MKLIDVDNITEKEVIEYLGHDYASCVSDMMDFLHDEPAISLSDEFEKIIVETSRLEKLILEIEDHGMFDTKDEKREALKQLKKLQNTIRNMKKEFK